MRIRTPALQRRRLGIVLMLELLFVLPVMLLFLMTIVQFYLLATAREEMLAASRLAARIAAAGDRHRRAEVLEETRLTVQRAFGSGRLSSATLKVVWAEDLPPAETAGEADWIQVSLEIPTRRVAPDVLGWVGVRLQGQQLIVATAAKQES